MFLIHRFACPWGSIISGQRVPRVVITPFSVEKLSAGRPRMFQSRTSEGSAMNSEKEKPAEAGMFRSTIKGVQAPHRAWRYSLGKGPAYDMNAAATATSPWRQRRRRVDAARRASWSTQ